MSLLNTAHLLLVFLVTCAIAQYDPYGQKPYSDRPPQYDRNNPYDRPGQGLSDRERYDRIDRNRTDPYGQHNPYDQGRYDPGRYDQGQYDRNRTNPYGQPQYPYDRNRPDPYNPYGNRSDPYGQQPYDRDHRYGQGGGQYDPRYPVNRPQGQDDANCCEDYCYMNDRDQYVRFGPVTAYQAVSGRHQITQDSSQCKPILFWSLNKHGTNYPSQDILQRMRTLINTRDEVFKNYDRQTYPYRGRLCAEDYDLLKNWRLDESLSHFQGGELTPDAKEELRLLSRRFQNKYRELLSVPYSDTHYRFKYTSAGRTYDSYQAYLEGLFNNNAFSVHAEIEPDDASRGYRSCYGGYGSSSSSSYSSSSSNPYDPNSQRYGSSSSYNNPGYGGSGYSSSSSYSSNQGQGGYSSGQTYGSSSGYNPGSGGYSGSSGYNTGSGYSGGSSFGGGGGGAYGSNPNRDYEYNQFKKNPEYVEMVRNVLRRLGYVNYTPNENVVEDMYNMCRYEKAWKPNVPSAWCAAFNKKQLQVLEYAQDLREYFSNGYGNEDYSNRIGCGLLSDMYRKFQRAIDGYSSDPKVAVNFATPGSIENLLVAMGMAKDYTPLSAQNYYSQTQRKWRTAVLSPFTANLVAVLHQCDSSSRDMYKVMFYLNENPMDFPECSQGLCSWDIIRTKYEDAVNRCDYCGGSATLHLHAAAILSAIVAILIFRY